MQIKSFFDKETATITYLIIDPATKYCAVIDSVLDYEPNSGKISTKSADLVINSIKEQNLKLQWILETHIHADHLTASNYLKEQLGGRIAIGSNIIKALEYWVPFFNIKSDTATDGSQFDHIFRDGEKFKIGTVEAKVLHTPGHTPSCTSYIIGDAVFVGDLLFMPYVGTGRTDFPGGDPRTMFHSIQKIFSLPDNTRIFTAHEYPADGEEPKWESTVAVQRSSNILAKISDEEEYVKIRSTRDQNKPVPKLLIPSLQINLRAGRFPRKESNGVSYLKVPLNLL